MAVALNSLTQGNNTTDAPSFTTSSYTPSANALVIVAIQVVSATSPTPMPTISGNGISWTMPDSSTASRSTGWYWGQSASPSAGTLLMDGGATTYQGIAWSIFELTGVPTSSAIAQFTKATGTTNTSSATLASAPAADSATIYVHGHNANELVTPRSGWTEIDDTGHASPLSEIETQYKLAGGEQTGSATFTTAVAWRGFILEVLAGGGAPPESLFTYSYDVKVG